MYDKKVLVAISDAMFSIAGILVVAYLAPEHMDVALGIIAALQPMVMVLINSFAREEVARIASFGIK